MNYDFNICIKYPTLFIPSARIIVAVFEIAYYKIIYNIEKYKKIYKNIFC